MSMANTTDFQVAFSTVPFHFHHSHRPLGLYSHMMGRLGWAESAHSVRRFRRPDSHPGLLGIPIPSRALLAVDASWCWRWWLALMPWVIIWWLFECKLRVRGMVNELQNGSDRPPITATAALLIEDDLLLFMLLFYPCYEVQRRE